MAKKEPSPKKPRQRAATGATTIRKRAAKTAAAPIVAPRLDYPQEGERLGSGNYTLRIEATQDGGMVEISIDQGPWKSCRPSVGYWWYDWAGFEPGEHVLLARLVLADGQSAVSPARRCVAEP